jgi:hypothetical protein
VTVTGSGQARTCDPAVPPCRNQVPLGPDGTGDGACAYPGYVCLAPNMSEFALLAALGAGPPLLIGSGSVTLSGQGRVYLAYNDGRYDDNCVGIPGPCGFLHATVDPYYALEQEARYRDRSVLLVLSLFDDAGAPVFGPSHDVLALTLVNLDTGEEAALTDVTFARQNQQYQLAVQYRDLTDGTWALTFAVDDVTTTSYVMTFEMARGCDKAYPDFCIPPPPPNLNCNDVLIGGRQGFTVLPPDPHRLDQDGDGLGCDPK